ncbi:unnamed protein product, partial [Mesorhabditis spiculigera]
MTKLVLLLALVAVFGMASILARPAEETERLDSAKPHERARRQFGGFPGMSFGQMAAGMGGNFPGIVQSSRNTWGSYQSQKQGGFNSQTNSIMFG